MPDAVRPIQTARLGWRPDTPDHRDLRYKAPHVVGGPPLPPRTDLRGSLPPVYDQYSLGSCTAHAAAGLAQFLQKKLAKKVYLPSRLFIYWNARLYLGETDVDNGATLRDTMKVISQAGLPSESLWWYNVGKFAIKPNRQVYADGARRKVGNYLRLDNSNLDELRHCLADGFPFMFGVSVYESFMGQQPASSGVIPMPGLNESLIGGHALLAVGYDDDKGVFLFRNSWGPYWGDAGYGTIPYAYLTNFYLADDFWTARTLNINL